MADNKQVDSRIDANSTSPRQTFAEQQLAIQDAQMARERAEKLAGEAAFRVARSRPRTDGQMNPGIQPRGSRKGK